MFQLPRRERWVIEGYTATMTPSRRIMTILWAREIGQILIACCGLLGNGNNTQNAPILLNQSLSPSPNGKLPSIGQSVEYVSVELWR